MNDYIFAFLFVGGLMSLAGGMLFLLNEFGGFNETWAFRSKHLKCGFIGDRVLHNPYDAPCPRCGDVVSPSAPDGWVRTNCRYVPLRGWQERFDHLP